MNTELHFDDFGEFVSCQEFYVLSNDIISSMKFIGRSKENKDESHEIKAELEISDDVGKYNTSISIISDSVKTIEYPTPAILDYSGYLCAYDSMYKMKNNIKDDNSFEIISYETEGVNKTDSTFDVEFEGMDYTLRKDNIAFKYDNRMEIFRKEDDGNIIETVIVAFSDRVACMSNIVEIIPFKPINYKDKSFTNIREYNFKDAPHNFSQIKQISKVPENIIIYNSNSDEKIDIIIEYDDFGIPVSYSINGEEQLMRYEAIYETDDDGSNSIIDSIYAIHPLFSDMFDLSSNITDGYWCFEQMMLPDTSNYDDATIYTREVRKLTPEDKKALLDYLNNCDDSVAVLDPIDYDDYSYFED